MINLVTARFAPVTGWAWRPAWWCAPPSVLRGGLRLALHDGVRLAGGRLQLAARPARIAAPAGPALAHGRASWRPGSPRGMQAAGPAALLSQRAPEHGEPGMNAARTERFESPGFAAMLSPARPAEPPHPAPTAHREDSDASAWPQALPVWSAASSDRSRAEPNEMPAQLEDAPRTVDMDDRTASRDGYPAAVAVPLGRSHSPRTLPPAPDSGDPSMPVPAALEPRSVKRPVPRGDAGTAALGGTPASLGDVLFDQAMQHRALPRFELHELPAAPFDTAATSVPQALGSARAGRIAERHPAADAPALSRAEVVRVADQVERLLQQRERFERERRGGF